MHMPLTVLVTFVSMSIAAMSVEGDTTATFHAGFEVGPLYLQRAISANCTEMELAPAEELSLWPPDGGIGIIDVGFGWRTDFFSYQSREHNRLLGVDGVEHAHPALAELRTAGWGEWGLNVTLAKAEAREKVRLVSDTALPASFGAEFDCTYRGIAHLRRLLPDHAIVSVEMSIKVDSALGTNTKTPFALLRHEFGHFQLPRVVLAGKRETGARTPLLNVTTEAAIVSEKRAQRRLSPDRFHSLRYTAWRSDPHVVAAALFLDDSLVHSLSYSFGTDSTQERSKYALYVGKLRSADFGGSITIANMRVWEHTPGMPTERYQLSTEREALLITPAVSPSSQIHLQAVDTAGTWYEPRYNSGPITPRPLFSPPLHYLLCYEHDGGTPLVAALAGNPETIDCLTIPTGLAPEIPYQFRIRVRCHQGGWSAWSNAVTAAAHPSPPLALDTSGTRPAYLRITEAGGSRSIDQLAHDIWYDLHIGVTPTGDTTLEIDILLNGDPDLTWLTHTQRGGPFDPRDNYYIGFSTGSSLLWSREKPGKLKASFIGGSQGLYVDGRPGAYEYDMREGTLRVRFRLLPEARLGVWRAGTYCRLDKRRPSTFATHTFLVGEEQKIASGIPIVGVMVLAITLIILVGLVYGGLRVRGARANCASAGSRHERPAGAREIPGSGEFDPAPHDCAGPYAVKIDAAKSFIRENYGERISPSDIARALCITPNWLAKMFRQATGMTVTRYTNLIRLHAARDLIQGTDKPITEIALVCGFSSPHYFSRVFQKHESMSPQHYRSHIRASQDGKALSGHE
ncbi:helix-turn-helix domain-containing protein [bacterium]|nr:helix-turn-helix domain-containing protein [bacterium]MBD3241470.1 helix-turn-helix domain-containing protein [Chitinivibrionales bacterium]